VNRGRRRIAHCCSGQPHASATVSKVSKNDCMSSTAVIFWRATPAKGKGIGVAVAVWSASCSRALVCLSAWGQECPQYLLVRLRLVPLHCCDHTQHLPHVITCWVSRSGYCAMLSTCGFQKIYIEFLKGAPRWAPV